MSRLYFTQPYYATPPMFFVAKSSKFQKPSDLDGKNIGVCAGCTHELYLKRTLTIPGVKVVFKVKNPKIVDLRRRESRAEGGRRRASSTRSCARRRRATGRSTMDSKLRAIKEPAFFMYPTGFVDRFSALDVKAFVAQGRTGGRRPCTPTARSRSSRSRISSAVDYATKAGQFDLKTIGQMVK